MDWLLCQKKMSLGLVFLDTLRHHQKMPTSMRVLVLGMFARRTYMYWIIHFFTVLSRDHGRGSNSLASKASGRRRTRGCIDGLFFLLLLLIVANSL